MSLESGLTWHVACIPFCMRTHQKKHSPSKIWTYTLHGRSQREWWQPAQQGRDHTKAVKGSSSEVGCNTHSFISQGFSWITSPQAGRLQTHSLNHEGDIWTTLNGESIYGNWSGCPGFQVNIFLTMLTIWKWNFPYASHPTSRAGHFNLQNVYSFLFLILTPFSPPHLKLSQLLSMHSTTAGLVPFDPIVTTVNKPANPAAYLSQAPPHSFLFSAIQWETKSKAN